METILDVEAAARMLGMEGSPVEAVREAMGDAFPKLPLHKVACIGALVASRRPEGWQVDALGAPHIGERSERDLISAFVDRIAQLRPQLITFNGNSFDLPALRYRAMVNRVSAPGLSARPYFNRYTDDALDLCDVLGSFTPQAKVSLDVVCKVLGLEGKPGGVDGSQVDALVREGRIAEVAWYCETDVLNTYRVWQILELFRGTITSAEFEWGEAQARAFLASRRFENPYLLAGPTRALSTAEENGSTGSADADR